jgi:3-hydroxyisobutyrate dehydrogenase
MVDLMVKDLGLAKDVAMGCDVDNAMGKLALALYESHQKAGNGARDFSSILESIKG